MTHVLSSCNHLISDEDGLGDQLLVFYEVIPGGWTKANTQRFQD